MNYVKRLNKTLKIEFHILGNSGNYFNTFFFSQILTKLILKFLIILVYETKINSIFENFYNVVCFSFSASCYNCSKMGHIARDCPENERTCYVCNKSGHISRQCTMNKNDNRNSKVGIYTFFCYVNIILYSRS